MEEKQVEVSKTVPKKTSKATWWVLGIIVFLLLVIIGSASNNEPSSQSPASTAQTTVPPVVTACSNFQNSQAKKISFANLNKDPNSFNGIDAEFTGQIIQIQESDGQGMIRLDVTKEDYGWSGTDIIYITYTGHNDFVENDVVTVYGVLQGSYTYTSQSNYQITLPSMEACSVEKPTVKKVTQTSVSTSKSTNATTPTTIPTPVQPQAPSPAPQTNNQNISPISSETISQKNAVAKAIDYLNYSAFSHDGLVAQLEYDQFSPADAVYGADNSGANWDEQAAAKAKDYMNYSAFSRGGLITQLEYDKFTQAQAEYGANAVGL
jgi:hypothetical protein